MSPGFPCSGLLLNVMSGFLKFGCSMLLAGSMLFSVSGLLLDLFRIVFYMVAILSLTEFIASSLVMKAFILGLGKSLSTKPHAFMVSRHTGSSSLLMAVLMKNFWIRIYHCQGGLEDMWGILLSLSNLC